ncbi:unnamed protein product, partial [marine sediment metagenome]
MVYMTASDLDQEAAKDINEMEKAASELPGTVKLTVLWDHGAGLGGANFDDEDFHTMDWLTTPEIT